MQEFQHEEKIGNRYILFPEERQIRKKFVRKVAFIMCGQLIVTISVMIPISFYDPARVFLNQNDHIIVISVLLMAAFTFFLIFCSWMARLPFVNYTILILLTTFTVFWMTCLCVKYSHMQVGIAICCTVLLALFLYVFAIFTRHDFTVILGVLLVISFIALILGIFFYLYPHHKIKWAIMIGSIILTCVYFLSDVQMIITGDRTFFLDMESHMLGACIMYIDFVYLFIYSLMIVGDFKGLKMKLY